MAVYKPNYCYPYLEGVDARLIGKNPFYFKCLIDTSNRQITGFQLTLYDNDNNEVFKGAKISPLSELPRYNTSSSVLSINSGLNGSELQIPAFQPKYNKSNLETGLYASYNAIYYIGDYNVKAIGEMTGGTVDEYELRNGDFYVQKTGNNCSLYRYDKSQTEQVPIQVSVGQFFNVEYGSVVNNITNANKNFRITEITNPDGTEFKIEEFSGSLFRAFGEGDKNEPTTEVKIFNNRTVYKWQITLFQGSKGVTITNTAPKKIDYTNLSNDEFDMVLQNATILGTTSSRLQIPKTEEIILNKYVELYNEAQGQAIAGSYRKSISSYDETYGHIYPEKDAFTPDLIENSDSCFVYKYSNNPDSILASDTVAVATTGNVALTGEGAIKAGTVIDGYVLQDGDYVLVKSQTTASQNGIYIIDKAAEPSRGQYNSWGDFIGKVVFVKNGNSNGKKNFISQARAGGTIGTTNLIFTQEQPLILYPGEIGLTVSVMSSSKPSGLAIDNYSIMNNDTCYCSDDQEVYVASVTGGSVAWNSSGQVIADDTKISVSYGASNGGKVFKKSKTEVSQDFSSQRATLYKNTTEKTFITPFLGLEPGQKIFLDNSFIRLNQDDSLTNVLSINTINTDNWSITHVALKVPFNSEAKIKYNLKSFFKTSDQNNFTLVSAPQARYSIQNTKETAFPFSQFISIKGTDIQVPIYSQGTINTRFVVCTGNYQQPQFLNWTNYRWLLLDSYGNILQDSGYRYDGTTKIAFYGLELNRYYHMVLMMTDEMGNVLSTGFRGLVRYESIDLGINFTATYNCNKQATELYYSENGIVQPGILTDQQTLTSSEVQYTYTFNTEDTSLSETNLNNGQMYILGKQGDSLTWKPGGTFGEDAQSEGIVYGDYGLKNSSDKYEYSSLYCADNGQMKLWSSHYLDGNFNGNIIHYEIDMKNVSDETFGDSNFICQFEIMPVANVFNSEGQIEGTTNNGVSDTSFIDNLNSNRNKIRFRAWIKIKEGNEEKIYPITVKIPDSINENNEIVYTEYFQPVKKNNTKTVLFSIPEVPKDLSNFTYKFINPTYLDQYGNLTVTGEIEKEFINTKNALYKSGEEIIIDKDCLNELGLFNSKGEKQNTNIGVNNLCLRNEAEDRDKNLSYWTDNQLVFVDSNFNNKSRAVLNTVTLNTWTDGGMCWDDGNGENYVPTEAKTHNEFNTKILKIDFQTLENFDTLRNLALPDQKEIIFTEGVDDSVGYYIGSVKGMGPCIKFKAYFTDPPTEEIKQYEVGIGEPVSGGGIDNE